MKAQIRVLSGALKGAEFVFSQQTLKIGRHPSSHLQFDPSKDLDVSGNHALLEQREGKWFIADLGSSNGTWVNGYRITAETKLDDTDQVSFGQDGPKVEFRAVGANVPDKADIPEARPSADEQPLHATIPHQPRATRQKPPMEAAPTARKPATSATQRIRVEVARQTKSLRNTTLALFGVLLVVAAAFFYTNFRQRELRSQEVAAMQARVDSILAASDQTVQELQGQMQSLADALETSRRDVRRLQTDLVAARESGDDERIDLLQQQLEDATSSLRAQQVAAGVDFNAVYEENQRAIAMVWTEFENGDIVTGTAFAVREDGTMLTNRHVVAGAEGNLTARRIAIKFADSYQVFPARILTVSDSRQVDLAVIRAQIRGGVPTVQGLAPRDSDARPGQPAAIIGFPLGSDLPMDQTAQGEVARTTLTVGTISKALRNNMQVDAWGAEGGSGSPIFDGQGRVIAILYAGHDGGLVFGVPATFAHDLLESVN